MKENSSGVGVIQLEAGRALSALTALQNISNRFDDTTPFLDSYTVARLLNRLSNHPDIQATDKARRDLIMKFGDRDEASGNVRITALSPGFNKYVEAYQPIADVMLDLPEIKKLNPKTLKHVVGVQPADALALFPLMEEISDMSELDTAPPPAPAQPVPPQAMSARPQ